MANPSEIRDTGRLAGDALAGIVGAIGHTQLSISRPVFDAIGPVAEPVRFFHNGLTRGDATVAGAHAVVPRAQPPDGVSAPPPLAHPDRRRRQRAVMLVAMEGGSE